MLDSGRSVGYTESVPDSERLWTVDHVTIDALDGSVSLTVGNRTKALDS